MTKTSELTGALLDYWVAKANGYPLCGDAMQIDYILIGTGEGDLQRFSPSTDWSKGGKIIERERIHIAYMPSDVQPEVPRWYANLHSRLNANGSRSQVGPTALIAAMRCYVAIKFGDEVPDVPA
jgi:hypothetical protein